MTVPVNRILKKILLPLREEITEKWKRINNKILIKHYSTDQIKKNETIGASGTMRERKYIHSFGTETQGKENT